MADGHGGARTPEKPAAASGPGRLSQRTDGGPTQKLSTMTDQEYGARTADLDAQRMAGMSAQDAVAPAPVPAGPGAGPGAGPAGPGAGAPAGPPMAGGGPFNAPSARPGEPVTAGVGIGQGPGSEVLPQFGQNPNEPKPGAMTTLLSNMAMQDPTGQVAKLYMAAMNLGA